MAQYRAIFNNAYFKGLATAAVVTVGLAAGQAQAAVTLDNLASGEHTVAEGETIAFTPSGDTTFDATLDIQSSGNNSITATTKDAKLSGEGTLNLNATGSGKLTLTGTASAAALTVDIKAINVNSGTLEVTGVKGKATNVNAKTLSVAKGATVAVTAADTASTLSATTMDIGTKSSNTHVVQADQKATINLGKSGALGTTLENDKTVSELSTINLYSDGVISALSGDGVTNTINAAVLNIKGGSLEVQAKSDGSSGATTTLNIASGSMDGGSIVVNKSAVLNVGFDDNDIKLQAGGEENLTKQFSLNSGELVAKGNITLKGLGTYVIGNDVTITGGEAQSEAEFNLVSGSAAEKSPTLQLSKKKLGELVAATKVKTDTAVLDVTGTTNADQIVLGTDANIKFAESAAKAGEIYASGATTLKADHIKVDGAVANAGRVDASKLMLSLQ